MNKAGIKKIWTAPKLTVLVKGRAENDILVICKTLGGTILFENPMAYDANCHHALMSSCRWDCYTRATS